MRWALLTLTAALWGCATAPVVETPGYEATVRAHLEAASGELVHRLRYNPTGCRCPAFEVALDKRWVRVELAVAGEEDPALDALLAAQEEDGSFGDLEKTRRIVATLTHYAEPEQRDALARGLRNLASQGIDDPAFGKTFTGDRGEAARSSMRIVAGLDERGSVGGDVRATAAAVVELSHHAALLAPPKKSRDARALPVFSAADQEAANTSILKGEAPASFFSATTGDDSAPPSEYIRLRRGATERGLQIVEVTPFVSLLDMLREHPVIAPRRLRLLGLCFSIIHWETQKPHLPVRLLCEKHGEYRTRTYEDRSQQIYSLPPLPLGTTPHI